MGFIASIKKKINGNKKKAKTLKFETTFHCGGCVRKVQPHMDAIEGLQEWDVKQSEGKKLLIAKVDQERSEQISKNIKKALEKEGYNAELI